MDLTVFYLFLFLLLPLIAILGSIAWIFITDANVKKEAEQKRKQSEAAIQKAIGLNKACELDPIQFEALVGEVFRRMGYQVRMTKTTGDDGIDLWLTKDQNTEIVQCKRYKGNISVRAVREFYGVIIDKTVHKGYFVSTGNFTMPARRFAEGKNLQLIDGAELSEWLYDHGKRTGNTTEEFE